MLFSRKLVGILAVILSLVVTMTTGGVAFAQEELDEDSAITPQFQALSVRAPRVVPIGESVPIMVTERGSGNPISGAEVRALRWPLIRPVVANDLPASAPALDTQLPIPHGWHYRFLGRTGEDGTIPPPAFERAGRLLIIATYNGYAPGLHVMAVQAKALAVRAPKKATVDEPVTITVTDRHDGEPIARAKVYALRQPLKWGAIDKEEPFSLEPPVQDTPEASLKALAVKYGVHINTTDENGQVIYTFHERGQYLIVATKDGYIPGITRISIGNQRLPNQGAGDNVTPGLRFNPKRLMPLPHPGAGDNVTPGLRFNPKQLKLLPNPGVERNATPGLRFNPKQLKPLPNPGVERNVTPGLRIHPKWPMPQSSR